VASAHEALTEARRSASDALATKGLGATEREQLLWTLSLLESIERTARRTLRATVVKGSAGS